MIQRIQDPTHRTPNNSNNIQIWFALRTSSFFHLTAPCGDDVLNTGSWISFPWRTWDWIVSTWCGSWLEGYTDTLNFKFVKFLCSSFLKDFPGSLWISGFCLFQSISIFQLKRSFVELFGNRPEAWNLDCPFAFGWGLSFWSGPFPRLWGWLS